MVIVLIRMTLFKSSAFIINVLGIVGFFGGAGGFFVCFVCFFKL